MTFQTQTYAAQIHVTQIQTTQILQGGAHPQQLKQVAPEPKGGPGVVLPVPFGAALRLQSVLHRKFYPVVPLQAL